MKNILTWFLCSYNTYNSISILLCLLYSFSINLLEHLMQTNQPPIPYTLHILTGKIYFCMQSISYLNICIFILWRIWQVGGILLYLWSDPPNLSLHDCLWFHKCRFWIVGYWIFHIWPDLFFSTENLYLLPKPKTSVYLSVDISYFVYTSIPTSVGTSECNQAQWM